MTEVSDPGPSWPSCLRFSVCLSVCVQNNHKIMLTLPNHKVLGQSELKASADDKIKFAIMMIFVFNRVGNIVGKGENAGYQHFLLFTQCFQKPFYFGSLEVGSCVVKS